MVSVKKNKLRRILIIIITVIFVFCVVSMIATKCIYDAIFARYDEYAPIPHALSSMVQNRKICSFSSGENQLTGYHYSPPDQKTALGLIVLVPGFAAGGDDYLWLISELGAYGWGVFTFDPTGTCQSQGESQVGFSQVIPDLEAALKYVENNNRFGYNKLVLMGHSRGAYAACCVLEQQWDVSAVVAISGVNSAMEGVMQLSTNTIGPVSYGNYGFLWLYQAMLFGTDTLELDAAETISESNVPVLVIHGTLDEKIPVSASSIISHREEILSGNVEYVLYDAGHTDILYEDDGTANDAVIESVHKFLLHWVEQ